jgi:hypothetical protein
MLSTYIGSGDVSSLMAGKDTKAYLSLMQRFVSNEIPYYNAKESPIDALRTGAILEERFFLTLDDSWFCQYFVQSKEMDVFKATLDFAQINGDEVVDFIELKTVGFNDYLTMIEPIRDDNKTLVEFLKKKHKAYYYQIQEQLYCTNLERAHLCFLSVTSYDDDENYQRIINSHEYTLVEVERDDAVINAIRERGQIFQTIKNNFKD